MSRPKRCRHCGKVLDGINEQFHKVLDPARGYYFYCDVHAKYMASYSSFNPEIRGTEKKHGFTFGYELEIGRATWSDRPSQENLLYRYGFLPSEDATVRCEWKSPVYQSMNPLPKMLKTLANQGLDLTSNCGTHVCIGHVDHINGQTMGYVRRFYQSLFTALSDYMLDHEEDTIKIYGRKLNSRWATEINMNTDTNTHSNFINCTHSTHIEFRICKFNSEEDKQFMNMIKLSRDMTSCIIENFIKHFNDTNHKGMTELEYRKHKANITSQKLVKLFIKYSEINY